MPQAGFMTLLSAGTRLGPYEVLAPVGAGAMGTVYKARDTRLGRLVALKVSSHEFSGRFEREARVISALNHPHICTVYDVGASYLVLELIEGETLAARLKSGALPIDSVIRYGSEIADALAAAHAQGIVHRDLKPGNIMVTGSGVKVLDFGLAKMTTAKVPDGPTVTLTAEHTILGTLAYMAPEQVEGIPVDSRGDIFALGGILFEMLTGRRAFLGDSSASVIASILKDEPPTPSSLTPGTPPELDRIMARCLAKNPDQRWQNAGDLRHALDEVRVQLQFQKRDSSSTVAHAPVRDRAPWVSVAVAVVVFMAAAAFFVLRGGRGSDSIAVLPFAASAADAQLENLSEGVAEQVINNLTQVSNLKVLARATTFTYRGKQNDPRRIGKELGVRTVLMGRVSRGGDDLKVQVDLVDVSDGSQIWGEQYHCKITDAQGVPAEIVRAVAGRMRIKLEREAARRLARHPIVNPQAYELYLQGRRAIGEMTPERIRQGKVYFEQAIAHDPSYAAAYAGLADSYSYLAVLELEKPASVMPQAKENARKALALDNETAEAYTSLGIVQSVYEWDWAGSEKQFRRAIELKPGDAYVQHWYGHYLEAVGRWDKAVEQMQKAVALDPLSAIPNEDLGYDLIMNGHYDEAVPRLRKVTQLDPEDALAHAFLALALEGKGLRDESRAENDKARKHASDAPVVAGFSGGLYCRLGAVEEARKMLMELQALARHRYVSPLEPAMIHFALGEKEEGFRLLNVALEDRSVNLQYNGTDRSLDSVRRDPRLQAVRQKLGLQEAAWPMRQ